jgi:hypothetical protein
MTHDLSGWGYVIIDIVAVIVLGALLAWGSHESLEYRRRRGRSIDARSATPQEVATNHALGQGHERSSGNYLLRLGLPVIVALFLVAYLFMRYMPRAF